MSRTGVSSLAGLADQLRGPRYLTELTHLPNSPRHALVEQAVAVLQNERIETVFAWLHCLRSIRGTFEHAAGCERPSREQLRALITLQPCLDEDIRSWLRADLGRLTAGASKFHLIDRIGGRAPWLNVSGEFPYGARSASDFHIIDNVANLNDLSSNSSALPPIAPTVGARPSLPSANHEMSKSPYGSSVHSNDGFKTSHKYFCTVCAIPLKLESDWKKHEIGHEMTYVCMLHGPYELNEQGIVCTVCGLIGPGKNHFLTHGMDPCADQAPNPFTYKRRHQLVTHLSKQHGFHDDKYARAVADKWEVWSGKQAWSCGFCVRLHHDFKKHLMHMSTDHFEKHQKLDAWSATNVINGFLQQPEVAAAWGHLVATRHPRVRPNMTWAQGSISNLQLLLEQGPSSMHTPQDLAEAAYAACTISGDGSGQYFPPVPFPPIPGASFSPGPSEPHRYSRPAPDQPGLLESLTHFLEPSLSSLLEDGTGPFYDFHDFGSWGTVNSPHEDQEAPAPS